MEAQDAEVSVPEKNDARVAASGASVLEAARAAFLRGLANNVEEKNTRRVMKRKKEGEGGKKRRKKTTTRKALTARRRRFEFS